MLPTGQICVKMWRNVKKALLVVKLNSKYRSNSLTRINFYLWIHETSEKNIGQMIEKIVTKIS